MAIRNLREIEISLKRQAKVAPEAVVNIQKAATLELQRGIVVATPVDKGRARGNWQVAQGSPASGDVAPNGFPGESSAARGAAATAAALTQGAQAAAETKPFSKTYVSNRLPYIEALNEGTSTQAPAGFIETAVNRVRRIVAGR
jgi:hypothetical protein